MITQRTVIPLCYCLLFAITATTQNGKVQLNGEVLDAISKQKLPYVTVIANTLEMVFVEGTTTNDDGQYLLELPKGKYVLQFSFIGYQNIEQTIELVTNQQLELLLVNDLTTLETVVVTEERTSVE